MIEPGDDLPEIIIAALGRAELELHNGDVLVIAQKIVSKAEGCLISLDEITASARANKLAIEVDKDPRLVELILRESSEVVRTSPGVIIVEHRLGVVLANAGIDHSNVAGDDNIVLLLPENPDRSAKNIRTALGLHFDMLPGIVISDSVGRPWRLGTTAIAIGCSGVNMLDDLRGNTDLFGRTLMVSETATGDCIASAANLLIGEGAEATPVVLIRGLANTGSDQTAGCLQRPRAGDLFR